MKIILIFLLVGVAAVLTLPADRWPNVGPTKTVVITPTSEDGPPDYNHGIAPKKDAIFHSSYSAIEQHYPPTHEQRHPSPHYPPPSEKKPHYDEKLLRKYYNNLVDGKVAFKKNLIQKAVDKTVDVTAKLTQYTVDFITRVAIETAAKLAKTGAKNVIHKKGEKFSGNQHHH